MKVLAFPERLSQYFLAFIFCFIFCGEQAVERFFIEVVFCDGATSFCLLPSIYFVALFFCRSDILHFIARSGCDPEKVTAPG